MMRARLFRMVAAALARMSGAGSEGGSNCLPAGDLPVSSG